MEQIFSSFYQSDGKVPKALMDSENADEWLQTVT